MIRFLNCLSGRPGFPEMLGLQRWALFLAGLATVSVAASEAADTIPLRGSDRPNIVLIMADDLGYECLGCNGGKSYRTPNLDRMANNGIRFTQAHSQPLCTPTRNQIMTGKYNFRNYENFEYLNPNQKTFAHLLKENGYRTCIAGKWQLNGRGWQRDGRKDPLRPRDAGFDATCLWQVTDLGQRYEHPLLEVNGERRKFEGQYGPDVCTDFIIDFVKQNRSTPFFVYYPMILTHSPFVPTPDSKDWLSANPAGSKKDYFADMVQYMDKLVGRIEKSLEEQGLLENTLLIFTGDNGTTQGLVTETVDGPVAGAKGTTLDTGTHVPLIIRWPKQGQRSVVCDDLVDFTDILPTLMDVAGCGLPEDFQSDGTSFFPQLKGEAGNPRQHIYCFYDPVHSQNVNRYRNRFARGKRFKVYRDGSIYDVTADPLEEKPLQPDSLDDAQQKEIRRLVSVLDHYDQQGAAQAASLLAEKTRPQTPGASRSGAGKKKKKSK